MDMNEADTPPTIECVRRWMFIHNVGSYEPLFLLQFFFGYSIRVDLFFAIYRMCAISGSLAINQWNGKYKSNRQMEICLVFQENNIYRATAKVNYQLILFVYR